MTRQEPAARKERYRHIPSMSYVGRKVIRIGLLTSILGILVGCGGGTPTLILATTTSTADSGLLEALLPSFEEANDVKVDVVAVGTGQAFVLGQNGDADIILIHDRNRADTFVAEGYGVGREDVMYNDFVIIGPESDPASVRDVNSAPQALSRIAQAGIAGNAIFISRADNSGTYSKELALWEQAGSSPEGDWYRETGQGMGSTLTIANELSGYALSDRGTYLARTAGMDLAILVEGDPLLFNPYGVIAVDPVRFPHVEHDLASRFVEYLTSYETQERIGAFGQDEYGQPLFQPNSDLWRERQ